MQFEEQYSIYLTAIETYLHQCFSSPKDPWPESDIPLSLYESISYSLMAGGKRLRPVLLLASYHLLADDYQAALPFAGAIEMIHTYSLIHDDLPAMDNDDIRRGKPSSHIAFGEAMAILAGDALLNLAFELMSSSGHPRALKAIRSIAHYSGARGMIAGQAGDIIMEGKEPSESMLHYIHHHKTADMITSAILAGLYLAGCQDIDMLKKAQDYGFHLGMAFQIADDLLDILGNEETIGKRINKDKEIGKLTWPSVYGIDESKNAVLYHVNSASDIARTFQGQGQFLAVLAEQILRSIA